MQAFYVELFGWSVNFDSDWFVHLQAPENASIELRAPARSVCGCSGNRRRQLKERHACPWHSSSPRTRLSLFT